MAGCSDAQEWPALGRVSVLEKPDDEFWFYREADLVTAGENAVDRLWEIVVETPGLAQDELINDFMNFIRPNVHRAARSLVMQYNASATSSFTAEATSHVYEAAMLLVHEFIENPDSLSTVTTFDGLLRFRAREGVRRMLDRMTSPASEMVNIQRRRRKLAAARSRFIEENQYEPSDQEVVDAHNARITNWDAAKHQGAVATVDDLRVTSDALDVDQHDAAAVGPDDFVLHPMEGPLFVRALIKRCEELDRADLAAAQAESATRIAEGKAERARAVRAGVGKLADTARAFLRPIYVQEEETGKVGTQRDISRAVGVSASIARNLLFRVREVAMDVLEEDFGITADDVAA